MKGPVCISAWCEKADVTNGYVSQSGRSYERISMQSAGGSSTGSRTGSPRLDYAAGVTKKPRLFPKSKFTSGVSHCYGNWLSKTIKL